MMVGVITWVLTVAKWLAVKSVGFFTMREYLPIMIKREVICNSSTPKERKIVISNYYSTHWLLNSEAHFVQKINLTMLSDYTCLWAGGEANPWGFPARPCFYAGARVAIIPPSSFSAFTDGRRGRDSCKHRKALGKQIYKVFLSSHSDNVQILSYSDDLSLNLLPVII